MFLDWAKTHRSVRTHDDYEICVGKLRDYFGNKMLSQISAFQIEAYKVLRVKEGARVRPNRELAALRNSFNKAIKLKKFEGAESRPRFRTIEGIAWQRSNSGSGGREGPASKIV